MSITHLQLREKFANFWKSKNHIEIPPIPLIPRDDPTTLFTGSGMQQLVPYLLGEPSPLGKRLYNIQRCLRAQDIEEVGDNRHDTFFEMMGNWSLGDYFKKEQIDWFWEFLTKELLIPKEKLYVTVFSGDKTNNLPADDESYEIWKKLGIEENHIFKYGPEKNWWSRAGVPNNMPAGEPGGSTSEIFYEFIETPHDKKFGDTCHPNCECGRFIEIGNCVFMRYKKERDGTFSLLPSQNVDFGGGLERLIIALENQPDLFQTQIFAPLIKTLSLECGKKYEENKFAMRIIADHIKTAVFLAREDIEPSNKEQGYIMRRLIRRSVVKMRDLNIIPSKIIPKLCQDVFDIYKIIYFKDKDFTKIISSVLKEANSFLKIIDKGIKILQTQEKIDGKSLFDLKQSYGFPFEIAVELLKKWGGNVDEIKLKLNYDSALLLHQNLSRSASVGKFKGGLADNSVKTLKYHTTTHLLHQALFDVLGNEVRQEGSNITGERLRFDFYLSRKPTEEEIKKVESIINDKITKALPITSIIIPKEEALKLNAKSFFREKYPDMVKIYLIGGSTSSPQDAYSKEFCGGPHVSNTKEIGEIKIFRWKKIGSNQYRIYAK